MNSVHCMWVSKLFLGVISSLVWSRQESRMQVAQILPYVIQPFSSVKSTLIPLATFDGWHVPQTTQTYAITNECKYTKTENATWDKMLWKKMLHKCISQSSGTSCQPAGLPSSPIVQTNPWSRHKAVSSLATRTYTAERLTRNFTAQGQQNRKKSDIVGNQRRHKEDCGKCATVATAKDSQGVSLRKGNRSENYLTIVNIRYVFFL